MRFRQVHLDFHTSEFIENIGEKFDKKEFQEALKAGHVDSITLFSKCHHGWAYHPSKKNEMHPHLKFDLLRAQLDAAHEIGVKTPVYLSAGLDEKMVIRHPEWLVRDENDNTTWVPNYKEAGYHKFCMNTPYLDYLLEQIIEVCKNYDADGIFLDIVGVQPCYCSNCRRTMLAEGKDPFDIHNVNELAERVYANYTKRVREAIDSVTPGLPVFHNGGHIIAGRRDLAYMNTHLELESLPTGGWGYDHFPISATYVRNLGMDYLGMTGKFHFSWGEFGGFKHPNAIRYETALSAAFGAKSSIGDQLHPSGKMEMATYKMIGEGYKEIEEKEPWLDNVTAVTDIAVLSYESVERAYSTGQAAQTKNIDAGASRIMLEGHYLFDFVDTEIDFNNYKVLILPDLAHINDKLKAKIKDFVKNGGKVLATGESGLNEDKTAFALDFGAEYVGESEFKPTYLRPDFEIDCYDNSAFLVYAKAQTIKEKGGKVLASRENPFFNRTNLHFSSHQHTPNTGEPFCPGIIEGKDGIYIGWNLFTEYADMGTMIAKKVLFYAIDRLLGDNKSLKTNLPAQGVTTINEQKEENRYVVHLLYVSPVKRGYGVEVVEDIVPIYDTKVSLKLDKKIRKAYLAPTGEEISFTEENGRYEFVVPKIENHQMLVLDY
ncbi:MAG: beta-galactosidase trimerization domain-containing protein [Clostridia bacterium]|nr:beta-galactosidase trimerization domain-containing protein [Clostridia bacterium]